jgi:hypothetical protein
VHELPCPDDADRRPEHPQSVRGGVVEQQRVAPDGRAAARGEPLAVQRRAARQHREQHPQARMRAPADVQEREPHRLHLRDVVGERGPPRRQRGARAHPAESGDRSRMDEQRCAVQLEALQQRPDALERAGGRKRGRGQREARIPTGDQRVHIIRIWRLELHRAPPAEARRQRIEALVVGFEQQRSLLGRERLDPERAGERHKRAVDAVPAQLRAAQLRVGRLDGQHAVGLARDAEGPAAAPTDQRGRLPTPSQRGDQGRSEEVLMDVDALHAPTYYTIPTNFTEI